MIPRIIHQTWKDSNIPDRFQSAAASWRHHHPDWEYRLWTHDDLAAFVEKKYPEIWPLYQRYPEDIQRVDAARYMFLHHYGGLYSDLDIVCNRSMAPFLSHGAVMARTKPTGLANDLMMTVPGHPLFREYIDNLEESFRRYQRFFILRHFRVLMTTGPLFVTRIHKRSPHGKGVFLLSGESYDSQDKDKAHVLHIPGDTWAGWDTHMLNFIADHSKPISCSGLLLILLLSFILT